MSNSYTIRRRTAINIASMDINKISPIPRPAGSGSMRSANAALPHEIGSSHSEGGAGVKPNKEEKAPFAYDINVLIIFFDYTWKGCYVAGQKGRKGEDPTWRKCQRGREEYFPGCVNGLCLDPAKQTYSLLPSWFYVLCLFVVHYRCCSIYVYIFLCLFWVYGGRSLLLFSRRVPPLQKPNSTWCFPFSSMIPLV